MLSFCEQMGHNIPREILLGLCCLSLLCILHQTESRAMCWTCGSHTIHTIEEPGSTSKHSHLGMETRNSSPEFLHGIASLKISATDWGSLIRFNRVTLLACAHIGLHRYLVVKEKLLIGVLVNLHGQCAGFRNTRRLRHTPVLVCKNSFLRINRGRKDPPWMCWHHLGPGSWNDDLEKEKANREYSLPTGSPWRELLASTLLFPTHGAEP